MTVIIDTAEPPEYPAFPKLWLNILVSLGLGIIAGIAYVIFLDYLEEGSRQKRFRALETQDAFETEPSRI